MTGDERLIRCFEAVFPELAPDQVLIASVDNVPAWDSLAAITLIALVEEQFDLRMQEEMLPQMSSFAAFRDYLKREHRLG